MMKSYDNRDFATLLGKFERHLTCWQVGLSLGSLLYFHMGDRWRAETKGGSSVEIGSTTLVLEADEWTITSQADLITDSDSVTQDWVDRLVFKYFIGTSLKSIEYTTESKECLISFANQGNGTGEILIHLRGAADEDICTITFPDGTIIVCNAKNGFLSDGSRSNVHVAAYSSD